MAPTEVPDARARVRVVPTHASAAFRILPAARVSVRPSLYYGVRVAHDIVVADMPRFSKCDTWDAELVLISGIGLGNIMNAATEWQGSHPWQGAKAIRYQARPNATRVALVADSQMQNL